jgi:VanZ family protein
MTAPATHRGGLGPGGRTRRPDWRFALPVGLMVLMAFASHQPQAAGMLPSGTDKLAHALAFALLAAAWLFALAPGREPGRTALAAFGLCAGWAVVDELHQAWVPGRDASVADAMADVAGAALVALLWNLRGGAWRRGGR